MVQELTIAFDGAGARCVYDDELAETLDLLGDVKIERASFVEPYANGTEWAADMEPVGGPILGPFRLRSQALAAERLWLARELGL